MAFRASPLWKRASRSGLFQMKKSSAKDSIPSSRIRLMTSERRKEPKGENDNAAVRLRVIFIEIPAD